MRCVFRGVPSVLVVGFVISVTGCAGGSSTPTAPSGNPAPSPAPAASPAPSPSPSPGPQPPTGLALAGVSLSESEVESQAQPQGIVSLTTVAPAGGVVVTLSSSDPITVRVPASVTIEGGASTASFGAITTSVSATTQATISASYGGVTRGATLTVRPPVLTALFTVRSPARGVDSCVLGPTDDVDCAIDGTSSRGFVERWHWSYWAGGSALGHTTTTGLSKPRLPTRCAFLEGARGGDNADGSKYIQMTIELVIEDRSGTRSSAVRRAVKLYPDRLCGFSY
jgi:hypothetical protein